MLDRKVTHGYVQWTLPVPRDWERFLIEHWQDLPKKPDPTGDEILDDQPGHVFCLNVMGMVFKGDHYSIRALDDGTGGVRVLCWSDDLEDFPVGRRHGLVWCGYPPEIDSRIQEYNPATHCTLQLYMEDEILAIQRSRGLTEEVLAWQDFPIPPESETLHGLWVPNELALAHDDALTLRTWYQYPDGVPEEHLNQKGEITDGKVQ